MTRSQVPAIVSSSIGKRREPPRVALLVETSTSWGTDMVRGVARWAESFGPWSLFLEPRGRYEKLRLPRNWRGEGVIARVNSRVLADEILTRRIPCVDVSWWEVEPERIPRCTTDDAATGRMAALYFLERGYRNLAYVPANYRRGRRDGVAASMGETVRAANAAYHLFDPHGIERNPSWHVMLSNYAAWLKQLPQPLAVVTFDAATGRQICDACRSVDLAVPEQVAVLAAEHDDLGSEVSFPRLSSIDHIPERVGMAAAGLLAKLMAGESPPSAPQLISPGGVVTRASTDILAIEDPRLVTALRFIQENYSEPIRVPHVLAKVSMSRRSFEQMFQESLGRSPADEITRVRIIRAKELLIRTDLNLVTIAARCGFDHAEVLTRVFRREVGMPPSVYRKQNQS